MVVPLLVSCSSNQLLMVEHNKSVRVRSAYHPYEFIGTQFSLSKKTSLTALHVALASGSDIIAKYPDCDLAIVHANNTNTKLSRFSRVDLDEDLNIYGYVKNIPTTVDVKATENIRIKSKDLKESCQLMYTNIPAKQGMSGSPLYNRNGDITGVFVAIEDRKYVNTKDKSTYIESRGVFVPYQTFESWLSKYQ